MTLAAYLDDHVAVWSVASGELRRAYDIADAYNPLRWPDIDYVQSMTWEEVSCGESATTGLSSSEARGVAWRHMAPCGRRNGWSVHHMTPDDTK